MDGVDDKISMSYTPFSGQFTIKSAKDSLIINDYTSTDSVHFVSRSLLELLYSPRGGSDDGYQNAMILYFANGKIGIAMEIETDHQFDFPSGWGEYYATIKLIGENRSNYKLLVKTNDRLYSKTKHAKNHNLSNRFVLSYDTKRHIFYNDLIMLNGRFDTWDYSMDKFKAKHFQGNYPVIKLGSHEYYFVKGIWYKLGENVINGRKSLVTDCIR